MTAEAGAGGSHADDIAYLTALVKERDRARYYATLFAPAALRPHLFALYGLAAEIAQVPDRVKEAQLGEIRLQWWREALENFERGEAPAIRALSSAVTQHALPIGPLIDLVDAYRRDLYSDPPGSLSDLEGFLGETQSTIFQLAAIICGSSGTETADASGHAGIAYGLATRLARFEADRVRGRTIVPADMLSADGPFTGDATVRRSEIGPILIGMARRHLSDAQIHAARFSRRLQLPFLPLMAVRPLLDSIERSGLQPHGDPASVADIQSLTRMAWARLRGIRPTASGA